MKLDIIDIKRAYFHAKARRDVYVKLCAEDDEEEGMCGRMNKSMYGTRDASQNWEEEYRETLTEFGFSRGMSSPCVFYHKGRNLRIVVHGDDFTILGHTPDLDWYRKNTRSNSDVKQII